MRKKIIAALLLVVMIVPLFSFTSLAAGTKAIKRVNVVTTLGDSASSGFGLPDYNRHKKQIVYGKRIKGAYPDLVARKLGAKKLYPYAISGIRTYDLRFLLDNNFQADYILKDVMGYMSEGVITEKHLKQLRPKYQKAVKEADLILLDVGFDDIWIPTIACVYDIAEDGRFFQKGPSKTVQAKVREMGAVRTVIDTAVHYLIGFAGNPHKWAAYWLQWDITVLKWATDYFRNYDAIIKQIYKLNPDVNVVSVGCYNPTTNWSLLPGDRSLEHALQPYYDIINTQKQKWEAFYDTYYYVELRNIPMINNTATLPLLENLTLDDSGFNPHPTAQGHRMIANAIFERIGAK
ncbi:MAG: hypothetical protein ILO43_01170 [Clostridia bacterium]|nr:hypothetical protein [Clostridia bacterium]MBP5271566.1 hypothetical protein [Clostridia bacterium]